jgi:crotonobetainyl-CoA:carnitine CoA-transferase CaiB-like acyl-CoA transferase
LRLRKDDDVGLARDDMVGPPLDLLADVISTKPLDEWLQLAAEHGFAFGAAHQSIDELAADPHVARRNVFVEGTHPVAGPISYVGSSAIVDGEQNEVRRHAPAPGEHAEVD